MSETVKYDYEIVDVGDNGEFLSWATVIFKIDGEEVRRQKWYGTSEEPPGHSGYELALSDARAWWDVSTYGLEELLRPFGREWQREQEERRA